MSRGRGIFSQWTWWWALAPALLCCATARGQLATLQKDSKRECATCHLDWVDSFDRKEAVLLMDKPSKPAAALEETCLDCHDGSVGDSRRGVWLEHGHRRNQKPSDKIKVPPNMPLEKGEMTCRTCHTAHTVPGANDIAKIVFLRGATEGGLCQQCHKDRAYGQEHGSHPLAKLPFELPKEIYDAHGRMDIADKSKMACQTCHTAHGAQRNNLLVIAPESGKLCLTCHEKLRPMEWKVDAPREHPQNPKLKNDGQKQAVLAMGTRLGPNDTLVCFTCHKMHDNKGYKFMLADTLQDSQICLRCHEDRKIVMGSKHDLRTTRPEDKNKLGLTPEQAGPCGSCHSFHRYAREVKPGRGDPIGRCITCHQPKSLDPLKGLGFAHPPDLPTSKIPKDAPFKLLAHEGDPSKQSLACNTCHNPHDASKTLFLKYDKNSLCSTCHTERFAAMGGQHDFTKKPELKNARGWTAEQAGKCGFCHAVHGESDLLLWVGTKERPKGPDDLCLQCHRTEGLAAKKPAFAYNHPTGPKARPTTRPGQNLPLFNEHALPDGKGFVSCASCHDPHSDKQKEMLRVTGTPSNLCTQCHADKMSLAKGVHDGRGKEKWPVDARHDDMCTSCHMPHGNDPQQQRWAFVPAQTANLADGACMKCHPGNGWAVAGDEKIARGRAMHPTTLPAGGHPGAKNSGLPLATVNGADALACRTCHNPHAAPDTPKLTRVSPGQSAEMLCAKCHEGTMHMQNGMHARDALLAAAPAPRTRGLRPFKLDEKSAACGPCHATHAVEGSRREYLWASAPPGAGKLDGDARCLSCHDPNRAVGRTIVFEHPADPLRTLGGTGQGSAIPVTSPAGGIKVPTEIRCATCHTPHGGTDQPIAAIDARRATRPMVRDNIVQTCATCHGTDAPRMLLYWHTPNKREAILPMVTPKKR